MKTKAGLWIDHQVAVIVELLESGERIQEITSDIEKQLRRSSQPAKGPFPALEVPADDSREREYQCQLARYYGEIIACLKAADEILILGPGEAKTELKKRLNQVNRGSPLNTLAAADKMTAPQIVARVRQHFHREASRKIFGLQSYQTINAG